MGRDTGRQCGDHAVTVPLVPYLVFKRETVSCYSSALHDTEKRECSQTSALS